MIAVRKASILVMFLGWFVTVISNMHKDPVWGALVPLHAFIVAWVWDIEMNNREEGDNDG